MHVKLRVSNVASSLVKLFKTMTQCDNFSWSFIMQVNRKKSWTYPKWLCSYDNEPCASTCIVHRTKNYWECKYFTLISQQVFITLLSTSIIVSLLSYQPVIEPNVLIVKYMKPNLCTAGIWTKDLRIRSGLELCFSGVNLKPH